MNTIPLPILLDTDIGDDIDDALALAVILNSSELELIGVTTVFRDAPRRAILARQLLEMRGRVDVPVVAGCSDPLFPNWDKFPGGKSLGRQFEALDGSLQWTDTRHAIGFIIDKVRDFASRGETLTLVPIGALTNIALAFLWAPNIIPRCRVVLMGGKWGSKFAEPDAEWNILCDPEAAALVFRSGVDLTMVGLDVTMQCILSPEEEQSFHDSPHTQTQFLGRLIKLWGHPVTLHDPLTALTLFADVVRFEPMRIEVPLYPSQLRARTIPTSGPTNCQVAVEVDVPRTKSLFLERVLHQPCSTVPDSG